MDAFTMACIGLRSLGAVFLAMMAAYLPLLATWLPGNFPGPDAFLAIFSCAVVTAISVSLLLFPEVHADPGRFRTLRHAHASPPDQDPLLDVALRLTGLALAAGSLPRIAETAALIAAYSVVPGAGLEQYAATEKVAWLLSPLISLSIAVLLFRAGSSLIHRNGGRSHDAA